MDNGVFSGRVIFDHLPKTGGSALAAWLRETLGTGCVTPNVWGEHRDLIRMYGGQHSIISGHIRYYNNEILDPRYRYMTCLREPIDRALSWIFFCVYDAPLDENSISLKKVIPPFLETDGRECAPELLRAIKNTYVDHFCRVGKNGEVNDDERLANSIEAIHRYDVVGLYENYSRFVEDVSDLIQIEAPATLTKVNVTTQRPQVDQISPALRDRLIAWNQLDLRLYSEVKNLVHSRSNNPSRRSRFLWCKYERTPMVVSNTEGQLAAITPISSMLSGQEVELAVNIINLSNENWVGDTNNPINASYHWLGLLGEPHLFDGCRTRLPESGIMPGDSLSLGVRVLAPKECGCYTLVLTLVQEGVCWFEQRGFKPASLQIEVR